MKGHVKRTDDMYNNIIMDNIIVLGLFLKVYIDSIFLAGLTDWLTEVLVFGANAEESATAA